MLVQAQGKGFLSEILSPAWHQFGVFWNVLHAHAPHEKEELRMTDSLLVKTLLAYKEQWDEKLWHETPLNFLKSGQPKLWMSWNEISFLW